MSAQLSLIAPMKPKMKEMTALEKKVTMKAKKLLKMTSMTAKMEAKTLATKIVVKTMTTQKEATTMTT